MNSDNLMICEDSELKLKDAVLKITEHILEELKNLLSSKSTSEEPFPELTKFVNSVAQYLRQLVELTEYVSTKKSIMDNIKHNKKSLEDAEKNLENCLNELYHFSFSFVKSKSVYGLNYSIASHILYQKSYPNLLHNYFQWVKPDEFERDELFCKILDKANFNKIDEKETIKLIEENMLLKLAFAEFPRDLTSKKIKGGVFILETSFYISKYGIVHYEQSGFKWSLMGMKLKLKEDPRSIDEIQMNFNEKVKEINFQLEDSNKQMEAKFFIYVDSKIREAISRKLVQQLKADLKNSCHPLKKSIENPPEGREGFLLLISDNNPISKRAKRRYNKQLFFEFLVESPKALVNFDSSAFNSCGISQIDTISVLSNLDILDLSKNRMQKNHFFISGNLLIFNKINELQKYELPFERKVNFRLNYPETFCMNNILQILQLNLDAMANVLLFITRRTTGNSSAEDSQSQSCNEISLYFEAPNCFSKPSSQTSFFEEEDGLGLVNEQIEKFFKRNPEQSRVVKVETMKKIFLLTYNEAADSFTFYSRKNLKKKYQLSDLQAKFMIRELKERKNFEKFMYHLRCSVFENTIKNYIKGVDIKIQGSCEQEIELNGVRRIKFYLLFREQQPHHQLGIEANETTIKFNNNFLLLGDFEVTHTINGKVNQQIQEDFLRIVRENSGISNSEIEPINYKSLKKSTILLVSTINRKILMEREVVRYLENSLNSVQK